MGSIYLPYQKPPRWNADRAAIAYNCARLGLPMPIFATPVWEGAGKRIVNIASGKPTKSFVETQGTITWAGDYLHWSAGDAGEDYKYIDTNKSYSYSNGLTVFAKLRCTHEYALQNYQRIAAQHKVGDHGWALTRGGANDRIEYARSSDGSTWEDIVGVTDNFPLNEICDFTVTDDGTTVKFYKNGTQEGSDHAITNIGSPNAAACNLWIGADEYQIGNERFAWQGDMWVVIIFPVALTPLQTQTLHNNPFGMFEPIRSPQWIVPLAPTTTAPTTAAPTTLAPTTLAPTTIGPTTVPVATTPSPSTAAPTTAPPPADIRSSQVLAQVEWVEHVPTTAAPTTSAPTTAAPTLAPTTAVPTAAPTTSAPTTAAPTDAPTTSAPTVAPTTVLPTTLAPTTAAPTPVPTTSAPTTAGPTLAPTTAALTTLAPTTIAPTTVAPTTGPPEEICIKSLSSTITNEGIFTSKITKEMKINGNLC